DPNNDIAGKDKKRSYRLNCEFSDSDLYNVGNDDSYKPDKGKGPVTQCVTETTAEVGTIAGIVSAVAMALVGAISSYVSYQKKKFCFSIQRKDLSFRNVSTAQSSPQSSGGTYQVAADLNGHQN
uniref:CD99 antigen-like protein 2 n=1 Tax=Periophthalmus magnuspinnatus TaxID=409849 RepID=A0A3B3ZFU1_9GOBI